LHTWCILLVIYTKIITMHGHLNIKTGTVLITKDCKLFISWNAQQTLLAVYKTLYECSV
jgi:hypothetical protein